MPREFNFRDIGGLRTKNGRLTKVGLVFRSGEPKKIERSLFLQVIHDHRISDIVDLRTSKEFESTDVPTAEIVCRYWSIPLFENIKDSWVNPKDISPTATAERYFEMLEAGISSIKKILKLILSKPKDGILIHCAAGRDRTGIVISALLSMAGVDKNEVSRDYGKSNTASTDGYLALPATMDHLLDLIDSRYGSMVNFLLEKGIAQDDMKEMCRIMVE